MQHHGQRDDTADQLVVGQATTEDIPAVVALYHESAAWQRARGLDPGNPPFPMEQIVAMRVRRGIMWVGRLGGVVVGSCTIEWADPRIWPDGSDDAGYLHGLVVARAQAGRGIGRALLAWAATYVAENGRVYLRLDCKADNPRLRDYYAQAGFVPAGEMTVPQYVAARFERRVAEPGDAA